MTAETSLPTTMNWSDLTQLQTSSSSSSSSSSCPRCSNHSFFNCSSNVTIQPYEIRRVFFGVVYTLIALAAVVGNILVIVSVYKNRKLRTITNLFVVSLAFSDLMVGLFVLPFAIKVEVTNSWCLGGDLCNIFVTLDVLLCTASILNLCCISLDRYFAITRPLACATTRSRRLALVMIAVVWVLSVNITIPPLFGWKEQNRTKDGTGDKDCELIEERNYVIYSALGSFYIPLAIMLFVYANIFVVARNAQRRWRTHSSKGGSKRGSRTSKPGGSTPPSPVTARSPNMSSDDKERGGNMGVGTRVMSVMGGASGTVCCCWCFGKRQWTGTYALTVTDDWRSSRGALAAYNRQTVTESDVARRSVLIYGTRPYSAEHDRRARSLERDRVRCSGENQDAGTCAMTPYAQLLRLGKIPTDPVTRKNSSHSEVRLTKTGQPEIRLCSIGSEVRAEPHCEKDITKVRTKQGSDVQDRNASTPELTSTFFNRSRRHSSLDCVYYKKGTMAAESSTARAKTNSSEYRGSEFFCNRDLKVRCSGSLPVRLFGNRTVSITTATTTGSTTTPSTGSRASTGSGASGASSAEGKTVSPTEKASNPSQMNSVSVDRTSSSKNRRRSALHFDKTLPNDKAESSVPAEEDVGIRLTETDRETTTQARSPDAAAAYLFESPRRKATTGEPSGSSSFRSARKTPRSAHNQTADHDPKTYGSFGDVTMTQAMARQMSRLSQKTRDRRENSMVVRETKTVKTVSIVIGCFVLCWLPFFVVYIYAPFASPEFRSNEILKMCVTWLGYFNSVINPFIYAFYNYEFRSTFWQLTFGRFWKSNRRVPRGVAPSSPLNKFLRYQPSLRNSSVIVLNRLSTNR